MMKTGGATKSRWNSESQRLSGRYGLTEDACRRVKKRSSLRQYKGIRKYKKHVEQQSTTETFLRWEE